MVFEGSRLGARWGGFRENLRHNESAYWDSKIVEHYLRGLQYVLGDLDAEDASDR